MALPPLNLPDSIVPTYEREAHNPRSDQRTVVGAATKGPIADAMVSVYAIDDTGSLVGSAVATTTTDGSGNFTVSLPSSASGMLLVKTSGGSFIDESDTRPLAQRRRITLGNDEGFQSIILDSQSTVAITPYTDSLVERAYLSGRLGNFKNAMTNLMDLAEAGFGFSLFSTLPTDPAAPASDASSAERQYSLLLGAFANIANTTALKVGMAKPDFEILKAVILDMTDGSNDGFGFGDPIFIKGQSLPAVDFDQQLVRFRNNNFAGYAGTALPEWNTAESDLAMDFPPGEFFTYSVADMPVIWGLRVTALARTIRRIDGTGTHWNARGNSELIWAQAGEELIHDFTSFGGLLVSQSEFFQSGDNGQEQIINTTYIDRHVVTQNPDETISTLIIGRVVIENVTTGTTNEFDFEDTLENLLVKAKAELPVFEDNPADFEENPALPILTKGKVPTVSPSLFNFVDGTVFNADGTGNTTFEKDSFTWELVDQNRGLKVDFDNGESATYYILFTDEPELGDFVVADYKAAGRNFLYGSTVFSNFEDLVWTDNGATGIFRGRHSFMGPDGRIPYDRSFHLYPNGTGLHDFVAFFNGEGGDVIQARTGVCWDIDENGILNIDFVGASFERGFVPTPGECSSAAGVQTSRWAFELYDEFNDRLETVLGFSPINSETGNAELEEIFPIVLEREQAFFAHPPIAVDDVVSTAPGKPLTFDPLENDITMAGSIDPESVRITSSIYNITTASPATDSVSVDPLTGAVTITPNGDDTSVRDIEMNYDVRDSTGNLSGPARILVTIDPALEG